MSDTPATRMLLKTQNQLHPIVTRHDAYRALVAERERLQRQRLIRDEVWSKQQKLYAEAEARYEAAVQEALDTGAPTPKRHSTEKPDSEARKLEVAYFDRKLADLDWQVGEAMADAADDLLPGLEQRHDEILTEAAGYAAALDKLVTEMTSVRRSTELVRQAASTGSPVSRVRLTVPTLLEAARNRVDLLSELRGIRGAVLRSREEVS